MFYIERYFQNTTKPLIHTHCVIKDPKVLENYLKSYFDKFGDKACCFEDLKPYIVLDDESLSEWSSHLKQTQMATVTQPVYYCGSQTQPAMV